MIREAESTVEAVEGQGSRGHVDRIALGGGDLILAND